MKLITLLWPWVMRRGLELGGILVAVSAIDPFVLQSILATVGALLVGNWEDVSLGALAGLVGTLGGLLWNAAATFRNQVVVNGERVVGKELTYGQKAVVESVVEEAKSYRRPTLLERLFGRK